MNWTTYCGVHIAAATSSDQQWVSARAARLLSIGRMANHRPVRGEMLVATHGGSDEATSRSSSPGPHLVYNCPKRSRCLLGWTGPVSKTRDVSAQAMNWKRVRSVGGRRSLLPRTVLPKLPSSR